MTYKKSIDEWIAGILSLVILIFCGSVVSILASPFASQNWAILGFTVRVGIVPSLGLLSVFAAAILVILSITFSWANTKGVDEETVVGGGISLTLAIAFLTILVLIISFLSPGGKEWAIMGATKRLGLDHSLLWLGASVVSIIICIITQLSGLNRRKKYKITY